MVHRVLGCVASTRVSAKAINSHAAARICLMRSTSHAGSA
jgi:hypothetical protein